MYTEYTDPSDGIFISYRREDASGHAGRLYDYLAASLGKSRLFMDVDAIGPGADFVERIDLALSRARAMFVVIGPRWAIATDRHGDRRLDDPRDVVRREIAAALIQDVLVIPVLVGGAVFPDEGELPDDIKQLARLNAVELHDTRWSSDVDQLLAVVPATSRRRVDRWVPRIQAHIAPSAFWFALGLLAGVAVLGSFLGLASERFPSLVGLPGMSDTSDAQLAQDLVLTGINLFLGLSVAWLAPDDRTARWLAFGMVGTAGAFSLSAHHAFHAATGTGPFPEAIHVGYHATVAGGYAYALMLFPDGELPPIRSGMKSVLAALALIVMVIAFVLYPKSEGWVILYFGSLTIIAGALALFLKSRYLPSPFERERTSGYLGAYLTGAVVTVAFTTLSLSVQLHNTSLTFRGMLFAQNVVISLAPILTALPIILLVGLIRDRLWGTEDAINRTVFYGILVTLALTGFTCLHIIARVASTNSTTAAISSALFALVIGVLLVRPSRDVLMDSLRRSILGLDPDAERAEGSLRDALSISSSADAAVSALAEVARRSLGVTSGRIDVGRPQGAASWMWPDGSNGRPLRRLPLRSRDEVAGAIAVETVTRLRPSRRAIEELTDLGEETLVALLPWTDHVDAAGESRRTVDGPALQGDDDAGNQD